MPRTKGSNAQEANFVKSWPLSGRFGRFRPEAAIPYAQQERPLQRHSSSLIPGGFEIGLHGYGAVDDGHPGEALPVLGQFEHIDTFELHDLAAGQGPNVAEM